MYIVACMQALTTVNYTFSLCMYVYPSNTRMLSRYTYLWAVSLSRQASLRTCACPIHIHNPTHVSKETHAAYMEQAVAQKLSETGSRGGAPHTPLALLSPLGSLCSAPHCARFYGSHQLFPPSNYNSLT